MFNVKPRYERVGYNYVATVLELLRVKTYEEIAEQVGYESVGSLSRILDGSIPSHIHGEALWDFYLDTFGRKPPLLHNSAQQSTA